MKEQVRRQFARAASAYVTSAQHAAGDDLALVVDIARPAPTDLVLDVATGAGHTALALAPHVAEVVATDLTPEMLATASGFVSARAANVRFEPADAEALPFEDGSFDIVVSRIAPHHFPDPAAFVAEAARVLRPGGRFVLDDNMAPEDSELDEFMNQVEKWRDPGHVRAWRASEWRRWIAASGLGVYGETPLAFKTHEFTSWTARIGMQAADRDALAAWLLADAPPRCRDYFRVVPAAGGGGIESLSFTWAIIAAEKPALC